MKRTIIAVAIILTFCNVTKAQTTYTKELENAAKEISQKLFSSGKTSVAVLDFENSNKQISELGSWLANVFTTQLENSSNNQFAVKNRTDIEKAIQQIKSESGSGAFDSKTIQRLGEISGSDVIVYGEITLMDNEITVNIRTKNISLNSTIGGVLISFTATDGMRTKYDNYIETKTSPSGNTSNSKTTASGEGSDRPSKNINCKTQMTGDYCFQNNTRFNITVRLVIYGGRGGVYSVLNECSLQPGQKQCFYNLESKSIDYIIVALKAGHQMNWSTSADYDYETKGSVYVETCKEKTFIIK